MTTPLERFHEHQAAAAKLSDDLRAHASGVRARIARLKAEISDTEREISKCEIAVEILSMVTIKEVLES